MQYPIEISEWLDQHEDGKIEVITENGEHYFMLIDNESEHAPDADAFLINNLEGQVDIPGGE